MSMQPEETPEYDETKMVGTGVATSRRRRASSAHDLERQSSSMMALEQYKSDLVVNKSDDEHHGDTTNNSTLRSSVVHDHKRSLSSTNVGISSSSSSSSRDWSTLDDTPPVTPASAVRSFFFPSPNKKKGMPPATTPIPSMRKQSTTTAATTISTDLAAASAATTTATGGAPMTRTANTTSSARAPSHPLSPQSPDTPLSAEDEETMLKDHLFVKSFWKTFDDVVILSITTQLGIIFRIAAAHWFGTFDNTFRTDSALFVNLPLNCLSCWLMGFLSSGEETLSIIETRFTPVATTTTTTITGETLPENEPDGLMVVSNGAARTGLRNRRLKRQQSKLGDDEMREVNFMAFERRIRESPSLVLFHPKKRDDDVMEHYFHDGYQVKRSYSNSSNSTLQMMNGSGTGSTFVIDDDDDGDGNDEESPRKMELSSTTQLSEDQSLSCALGQAGPIRVERRKTLDEAPPPSSNNTELLDNSSQGGSLGDDTNNSRIGCLNDSPRFSAPIRPHHQHDIFHKVQHEITNNITRINRVDLAEGWDVGTTYEDMGEDLMLGLRDGFCGAISSFSSWSSSMVDLIQAGHIGEALTGYVLGLQLPIVAYRFGQTMAVYLFVWRCRRETRLEERKGFRFQVRSSDDDDDENDHTQDKEDFEMDENGHRHYFSNNRKDGTPNCSPTRRQQQEAKHQQEEPTDRETPSLRAIATAILLMLIIAELTSLSFFSQPEDHLVALSLLFSPFGVLARWKLSRYNKILPTFPLGTFTCNLLACALSGSLGSLLAGNPGPTERIVLVSMISGFAGSLSSVAVFIVEILRGVDPLLFKWDGFIYAFCTLFWAMFIGFVSSQTIDWADAVAGAGAGSDDDGTGGMGGDGSPSSSP